MNVLGNDEVHDSLMNTELLNEQIAALADTNID